MGANIYPPDATTVRLMLRLVSNGGLSGWRRDHQAAHLLDLRGAIPVFLYISNGRLNEINVLKFLPIDASSFFVVDRG